MKYAFLTVPLQYFSWVNKDLQSRQGGFSLWFSGSFSLAFLASPEGTVCDLRQLENSSASISLVRVRTQLTLEERVVLGFHPFCSKERHLHGEDSQGLLCAGGSSGRACRLRTLGMCCTITCLWIGTLLWVYRASPSSLPPPALPG